MECPGPLRPITDLPSLEIRYVGSKSGARSRIPTTTADGMMQESPVWHNTGSERPTDTASTIEDRFVTPPPPVDGLMELQSTRMPRPLIWASGVRLTRLV